MSATKKLAFIGTGIMGKPICEHLLKAGYELRIFTRTKAKANDLIKKGAIWCDSAKSAAEGADIVFTMLGFPDEVEEVYLAGGGILEAAPKGSYLIDLSTSSPLLAKELHDAAEVVDKHAFDCPVTGGESGAIAGNLTLICGMNEADAEPIVDVLKCFSAKIFYMGEPGSGQTTKLCNQISLGAAMVGYADALGLAEASGLNLSKVQEVIASGMGQTRALSELAPKSIAGDFKPGFLSEHLRKDLALALQAAEDEQISLPGTETAFNLYDLLVQVGGAKLGTQAISLLYAEEQVGTAAGLDWSRAQYLEEEMHEHDHDHHHHDHEHHHHSESE